MMKKLSLGVLLFGLVIAGVSLFKISRSEAQTPLSVTFTSPAGNPTWTPGTTQTVSWTLSGTNAAALSNTSPVRAFLVNKEFPALFYPIFISNQQSNPNPTSFTASIPLAGSTSLDGITPGKYFIRLSYGGTIGTYAENQNPEITITPASNARLLNITNPTVTSVWSGGTTPSFNWTSPNISSGTNIYVSLFRDGATDITARLGSSLIVPNNGASTIALPSNAYGGGKFRLLVQTAPSSASGSSISGFSPAFTINPPLNTLTVQVVQTTSGVRTSAGRVIELPLTGSQISCPPAQGLDCDGVYPDGSTVTLTALYSAVNEVFVGWSGDAVACGTQQTCVITMSATKNVSATFNLLRYPLNLTINGLGTVTGNNLLNCVATSTPQPKVCIPKNYLANTNVILTATPTTAGDLVTWSGCDTFTATTCNVKMSAIKNVGVTFGTTIPPVTTVDPSVGNEKLTGWAWSSNIGWISFSDSVGGTAWAEQYGVKINENNNNSLNGYAWSSKIGWIDFGPTSGPDGYPGTPANGARLVTATNGVINVEGWAQACSVFIRGCNGGLRGTADRGAWDGWIKMSDFSPTTGWIHRVKVVTNITNGVSSRSLDGYAWGSNNVGWINFAGVGLTGSGNKKLTLTVSGNLFVDVKDITNNTATTTCTATGNAISCSYSYPPNATVVLTPSVLTGLTWSGSTTPSTATGLDSITDCPNSTSKICTLWMSEDRDVTVEAVVVNVPKYPLYLSKTGTGAANGTVTFSTIGEDCDVPATNCKKYVADTAVTVNASVSPGSALGVPPWSGTPCSTSINGTSCNNSSFTFTKNSGTQIAIAKFTLNPTYQLNLTVSGANSISEKVSSDDSNISACTDYNNNGSKTCSYNYSPATPPTVVILTANFAPNNTTRTVTWGGSDGSSCSGTTCTVQMNAAKTVTAEFGDVASGPVNFRVLGLPPMSLKVINPEFYYIENKSADAKFCVRSIKSTQFGTPTIESIIGDSTYNPKCEFKLVDLSGPPSTVTPYVIFCKDLYFNVSSPQGFIIPQNATSSFRVFLSDYKLFELKQKNPYQIIIDVCTERSPDLNNTKTIDAEVSTCTPNC